MFICVIPVLTDLSVMIKLSVDKKFGKQENQYLYLLFYPKGAGWCVSLLHVFWDRPNYSLHFGMCVRCKMRTCSKGLF